MTEQTRRGKKTARYRARGLGFPFLWIEFWSCFSQRRIPDDWYYCLCWVELKWMVVQWIICFILSVPWKVLTCAVHVLLRPLSARWGLEGEIMPLLSPPAHPLITLNHPTCRTQRAGSCWGQPYYVFVIKGLLQSEGYLWQVVTTWFLLLLCSSVGIKVFFFPESGVILLESDSSFYSHTKINEIGTLISWVGMGKEEDIDWRNMGLYLSRVLHLDFDTSIDFGKFIYFSYLPLPSTKLS